MKRKGNKQKYFDSKKGKQQYKNYENLDKKGEDINSKKRRKDLDQEAKFKNKLLKKEYNLHEVERDGNCLFSSVSDQVYGTDKHKEIIREKCMDYIEKNKLFYSQFIEGGETQIPAYIQRKRKNGIWGDNLEIQALSEIYNRPIEIYVDVNNPLRTFCNVNDKNKFPIKLSYHGNNHYNSIVPSVNHSDYPLYKNSLLNYNSPGVYETKFIKEYDITIKFKEKYEQNFNEPLEYDIQNNNSFDEEDFLYEDAIQNSINKKEKKDKNNYKEIKNDEDYLGNPLVQNALEFGFNLSDVIEAVKVCGYNEELVMNYLCNKQSE